MNKYVVAFLSFHNNNICMEEVLANTKLEAALKYLNDSTAWEEFEAESFDDLHEQLANGDCVLEVLEINNSRSGRSGTGLQNLSAGLDSQASFQ